MITVGRCDGKPICPDIDIKECLTVGEAETFVDWLENNIDRQGVFKGDYYIDVPETEDKPKHQRTTAPGPMKITKAMVILSSACDKIYLETNLPCSFVKNFLPKQPPLTISFDATYDTGVQYVRHNFGLEPEVVNTRW